MTPSSRSVQPNSTVIRELRKHYGLTQEGLADLAKLSDRSIRSIESQRAVAVTSIDQLCKCFQQRFGLPLKRSDLVLETVPLSNLPLAVTVLEQLVTSQCLTDLPVVWCVDSNWYCELGTLTQPSQIGLRFQALRGTHTFEQQVIWQIGGTSSYAACHWFGVSRSQDRPMKNMPYLGFTAIQLKDRDIVAVWDYPASGLAWQSPSFKKRVVVQIKSGAVRAARMARLMTQADVASAARLSLRAIRNAEAGKSMELRSAKQIADALGIPLIALYADTQGHFELSEAAKWAREYLNGIWNLGDYSVIDQYLLPDFEYHHESGVATNREECRSRIEAWRSAFTDFDFRIDELVDLGTSVICRWNSKMTHSGPWLDLAPTRRRVQVFGATWVYVRDGKFGDAWDFWDPCQLYQELKESTC